MMQKVLLPKNKTAAHASNKCEFIHLFLGHSCVIIFISLLLKLILLLAGNSNSTFLNTLAAKLVNLIQTFRIDKPVCLKSIILSPSPSPSLPILIICYLFIHHAFDFIFVLLFSILSAMTF